MEDVPGLKWRLNCLLITTMDVTCAVLVGWVDEVLSDENRGLLKVIQEAKPQSISSLAELTGRKTSNLSRTLKTMANYGFVEMKREKNHVRPVAMSTEFSIMA
jgi:predicted transcriptional regulator